MIFNTSYSPVHTPRAAPPDAFALSGLAVITTHFNACHYQTPLQNYHRFADGMKAYHIPLYSAELVYDERPFVLDQSPHIHRFRTSHILWHKERLLNVLLKRLPAHYDKIAWIDADLLFLNPNWASEAAEALDMYPVVQLFENAAFLDQNGGPMQTQTGIVKAVSCRQAGTHNPGNFHPGFAWAARRSLLEASGLFDLSICGGGDLFMVLAMYGLWAHPSLSYFSPALRRAFHDWARPFWGQVQGRVGYVSGAVHHLWHGDRGRRKYVERFGWLRQARFDPVRDLTVDANGMLQWTPGTEWLQDKLRQYFLGRREDG